jgi:hypothetical protein
MARNMEAGTRRHASGILLHGMGIALCKDLHWLQVVCDFCERHLEANKQAFADPRLHLIINDARAELERYEGTFDVIIGDLADPVYGGPCYQVGIMQGVVPALIICLNGKL